MSSLGTEATYYSSDEEYPTQASCTHKWSFSKVIESWCHDLKGYIFLPSSSLLILPPAHCDVSSFPLSRLFYHVILI